MGLNSAALVKLKTKEEILQKQGSATFLDFFILCREPHF
jgi:hypothetical protein